MKKLKPEDLDKIAERMRSVVNMREGKAKAKVSVHMGTCGIAAGTRPVMTALREQIEKEDIKDVMLTISSCAGLCSREPMLTVEIEDQPAIKYVDVTPEKAVEILEKHVLGGTIVTDYALAAGNERIL
jgi:NADP-reducing hydrogenase subunit HndB